MTEYLLTQSPLTTIAGSPVLTGTNDGTILNDDDIDTYVVLPKSGAGPNPTVQTVLSGGDYGTVTSVRIHMVVENNYYDTAHNLRLNWFLLSDETAWWEYSSSYTLLPGAGQVSLDHTLSSGDPDVFYDGAMADGYDPNMFTDLSSGLITLRLQQNSTPGNGEIKILQAAVYVTVEGAAEPVYLDVPVLASDLISVGARFE